MSDAKQMIIPYYEVKVRFNDRFHPRGDFHTSLYSETLEVAERDFSDAVKRQCYSDVQLFRCDMAYSNGLSQGLVGRKMVKRWRERKMDVRTDLRGGPLP